MVTLDRNYRGGKTVRLNSVTNRLGEEEKWSGLILRRIGSEASSLLGLKLLPDHLHDRCRNQTFKRRLPLASRGFQQRAFFQGNGDQLTRLVANLPPVHRLT